MAAAASTNSAVALVDVAGDVGSSVNGGGGICSVGGGGDLNGDVGSSVDGHGGICSVGGDVSSDVGSGVDGGGGICGVVSLFANGDSWTAAMTVRY